MEPINHLAQDSLTTGDGRAEIWLRLLQRAIELATAAHEGQLDKGGRPYIEHVVRVCRGVASLEGKVVAMLHDVVEDTNVTLAQLAMRGFPSEVIDAVDAMTRREGEGYGEYIQRLSQNPTAVEVKLSDLTDNLDRQRIPNPTERDLRRWERYEATRQKLVRLSRPSITSPDPR